MTPPARKAHWNAGGVMGLILSSLGLAVLFALMWAYRALYGDDWAGLFEALTGYGLGGSAMALFGRVGGGIYTKAADVGADLVGKVEQGIPEDDPRNPAVIADNVGDNVGDIAGMGSDLFGSFAESTCAALVVSSLSSLGKEHEWAAMNFPLVISAVGIFVSMACTLLATELWPAREVQQIEPVLRFQLQLSTAVMCPARSSWPSWRSPAVSTSSCPTGRINAWSGGRWPSPSPSGSWRGTSSDTSRRCSPATSIRGCAKWQTPAARGPPRTSSTGSPWATRAASCLPSRSAWWCTAPFPWRVCTASPAPRWECWAPSPRASPSMRTGRSVTTRGASRRWRAWGRTSASAPTPSTPRGTRPRRSARVSRSGAPRWCRSRCSGPSWPGRESRWRMPPSSTQRSSRAFFWAPCCPTGSAQ